LAIKYRETMMACQDDKGCTLLCGIGNLGVGAEASVMAHKSRNVFKWIKFEPPMHVLNKTGSFLVLL
jgi:hypothetical protein